MTSFHTGTNKKTSFDSNPGFKEIEQYISYYKRLEWRSSDFLSPNIVPIINVDKYFYSSIANMLDTIKYALSQGRANDAWTLLRKYHDIIITNIVYDLELEESKFNFFEEPTSTQNWFLKNSKGNRFCYTKYIKKIADNQKTSGIYQLTYDQKIHDGIRDRCNNNAHINYFYNLLRNDPELSFNGEGKWLNRFFVDLKELFIHHICLTFILHEVYMLADDYTDYLDCDMTPPPGSEKWPDMQFQDILHTIIEPYNPEAAIYLKQHSILDLNKTYDE